MEVGMKRMDLCMAVSVAATFCLAGCGGGGSSVGVASTPTPTPSLAPHSDKVDIFQSPSTQEFAALGSGDEIRIRYNATTDKYEVMAATTGWRTLVDDPNSTPLIGAPNANFELSGYPSSFF